MSFEPHPYQKVNIWKMNRWSLIGWMTDNSSYSKKTTLLQTPAYSHSILVSKRYIYSEWMESRQLLAVRSRIKVILCIFIYGTVIVKYVIVFSEVTEVDNKTSVSEHLEYLNLF